MVDDAGRISELQIESLSSSVVEKVTKSLVVDMEDNQIIRILGSLLLKKQIKQRTVVGRK